MNELKGNTCEHGTEVGAAGCQHHLVSRHLYISRHQQNVTQHFLTGITRDKTDFPNHHTEDFQMVVSAPSCGGKPPPNRSEKLNLYAHTLSGG